LSKPSAGTPLVAKSNHVNGDDIVMDERSALTNVSELIDPTMFFGELMPAGVGMVAPTPVPPKTFTRTSSPGAQAPEV
jgi:hypothetical protein